MWKAHRKGADISDSSGTRSLTLSSRGGMEGVGSFSGTSSRTGAAARGRQTREMTGFG